MRRLLSILLLLSGTVFGTTFGAWQHKGTVLASSAGHNPQQPSVIYESGCHIVTSPCFKMWYNDWNGSIGNFSYAESTNGTTWTLDPSNPLISGQGWGRVVKNGATYYAYTVANFTSGINVYTSSDGLTWTLQKSGAILTGSAGQWDASNVAQLNVIDVIGGTWYGYYTGAKTSTTPWSMGLATSSDGINWVKGNSNPIITYEGPSNFDWHKVGNLYYGWSQVVLPNIPYGSLPLSNIYYPSDILRFKGGNVNGPFVALPTPVFQRTQNSEGQTASGGQVADPSIVSDGTNLWIFFTATAAGDGEDLQTGPWMINAAEAPNTTFAQLVTTYEGIQTFPEYTPAGLALTEHIVGSDNAQRANENPLSDGGNWVSGDASFAANAQLLSHQITGTSVSKGGEMYWSGAVTNDQWAQTTVAFANEAGSSVGILLRAATNAFTEYRFLWLGTTGSAGTFYIQVWSNGSELQTLTVAGTVHNGDTLTAYAIGTNLFFYQNGYLILSTTDSNLTSGKVGVSVYGGSTTATDAALSSWSGGNVVSLPANVPVSNWQPLVFQP